MPLEQIRNFRQAAPDLGTSGQPSRAQLADIAAAGYEVVINLALHDDPRYSLPDERASVEALGMRYEHIPVVFTQPQGEQLSRFFELMQQFRGKRTWVHCAANYRVTAFLGLYRHCILGWPEDEAFSLLRSVWEPDAVWAAFIQAHKADRTA